MWERVEQERAWKSKCILQGRGGGQTTIRDVSLLLERCCSKDHGTVQSVPPTAGLRPQPLPSPPLRLPTDPPPRMHLPLVVVGGPDNELAQR